MTRPLKLADAQPWVKTKGLFPKIIFGSSLEPYDPMVLTMNFALRCFWKIEHWASFPRAFV